MIDIRINDLVKKFGSVLALNNINLSIKSGELFFLLGPSGCGKTTLLRTIAGFYTPNSGSIWFDDHEITKLSPHRRKTGMVFQSYALWPHMTVFQNVAFGLEQKRKRLPKEEIRKRAGEALDSVQMGAFADRKPNELSGGQQQRVALARALAIRPRCLLLDEPLSNLDAKLRNEMRSEIRRICKEFKLTTIYVTHDQKEALSIADRMAVFSKGEIEQIGTPMELYRRPRNCFVAGFIGETNLIPGRVIRAGAGEALVGTKLGEFRGALAEQEIEPKPGDDVSVSLRPESIRLKHHPSEENCTDGVIVDAMYFGEVAHYTFQKKAISLRISELNPCHLTQHHQRGLYASILPEDVVILTH